MESEVVDNAVFTPEEIEPLVSRVLDRHLSSFQYTEAMVDDCVNRICEDVVTALAALDKPFKYIGARRRSVWGAAFVAARVHSVPARAWRHLIALLCPHPQ